MRRRQAMAALGGVILAASVTATAGADSGLTTLRLPLPSAVPIGVQPSVPAPRCTFPPLGPQELRRVVHRRLVQADRVPVDTVDSGDPCHILATSPHVVSRSDDSGHTWTAAFVAPSAEATLPYQVYRADPTADAAYPSLDGVVTPAPSHEYLIDQNGWYGIVYSADYGQHWEQRTNGLPVLPGTSAIRTLTFAPSNPQVGYTVVAAPSDATPEASTPTLVTALFSTRDGGASWQPVTIPATDITAVAIDPLDDRHVVVANGRGTPPEAWLWESSDGGQTWSQRPGVPNQSVPAQLLVTHARGGQVRLYMETEVGWDASGQPTGLFWQSRDDGASWRYLPVSEEGGLTTPVIAADPGDPDDMVLAFVSPAGARLASSTDGFLTASTTGPFVPSEDGQDPEGSGHPRLSVDGAHDFFLQLESTTSSSSSVYDDLFAFRLHRLRDPLPVALPRPEPTLSSPGGHVEGSIRDCPLLAPSIVPGEAPGHDDGGAIAYDGEYLDYSYNTTVGVISRLDPVTCRQGPPLVPTIPLDSSGLPQPLRQLAYDPRYDFASGDEGALLVRGSQDAEARADATDPVYAVDPLTGYTELALRLPPEVDDGGVCGCQAFAYDYFTDVLWVSGPYGYGRGRGAVLEPVAIPEVRGRVAAAVDTCMTSRLPFGREIANVLVTDNGVMYGSEEDDETVLRADYRTCTLLGGFKHALFDEPSDENEQMACDPITFGEGSVYAGGGGVATSVIWIRDEGADAARAYAIPDGFCPYPTRLTLHPVPTSEVGATVPLCAVLRRASPLHPPIAAAPVVFGIDGQPVASGSTDAAGNVCVTATAPGPAGMHTVRADFRGTHVFLPSHDQGPMQTFGLDALVTTRQVGPPLPPLTSPAEPAPVHQPQPAGRAADAVEQVQGQTQAQAQAQSQVQSQSNAQASSQLQPGMAVQRRSQPQVASQMAGGRQASPAYNASSLRSRRPPAAPLVAGVAVLLLGLSLARRRPAVVLARIARR